MEIEELLKNIAKEICKFESSNDNGIIVGSYITINNENFEFDGEKFIDSKYLKIYKEV